ncbi:MAG: hypothetical protein NTV48_02045 [Candidatus Vogelbacteria bacterium]|nr:hypothetical protein [Candidatus Vogelbacteria bacterium]
MGQALATRTQQFSTKEERDDLQVFCEKHKKATGPKFISPNELSYLRHNGKIKIGPITGQQSDSGHTITIIFALTKPTGTSPYGEIVMSIPAMAIPRDPV